jgi:nitroreductase
MENITLQHLLNRRSIRKYENRRLPKELIMILLQAAMNAPTACNQQCWHFIVIEDREKLNELSEIHGGYHTMKNAPLVILVCSEPGNAQLECFLDQDCAAATENILIAAESLGLGALWMGVNQTSPADSVIIRNVLNIPEEIKPFSFVALGYPAEIAHTMDKYDETKIHYSTFLTP